MCAIVITINMPIVHLAMEHPVGFEPTLKELQSSVLTNLTKGAYGGLTGSRTLLS